MGRAPKVPTCAVSYSVRPRTSDNLATMPHLALHEFIGVNRVELIRRCKTKVGARSGPGAVAADADHGVPLFLDQLVVELRDGPSQTSAMSEGAARHGTDLLRQGFSVSQVVHDYGDVCQSVTDLAVE